MYQFDERSAITRVMQMQKRKFAAWQRKLKAEALTFKTISYKEGDKNCLATVFNDGVLRVAKLEGRNIWTGDKEISKIFFVRRNGEFCRYVDDSVMFPMNKDLQQRVFTLLSKDGKSVKEFRVQGENVKAEEREEFELLCAELEQCKENLGSAEIFGGHEIF
ncbi:MAG: hypothetical protein J6K97_03340 [Clostridia bacterium]|nr:hypothetical protein [Clostridia bacterium]